MPKIDFTAYAHPVMAVRCPDCDKRPGIMCYRPSGHNASDFHRTRKDLADEIFISQHGPKASIERTAEGWLIDPTGYIDPAANKPGAGQFSLSL